MALHVCSRSLGIETLVYNCWVLNLRKIVLRIVLARSDVYCFPLLKQHITFPPSEIRRRG